MADVHLVNSIVVCRNCSVPGKDGRTICSYVSEKARHRILDPVTDSAPVCLLASSTQTLASNMLVIHSQADDPLAAHGALMRFNGLGEGGGFARGTFLARSLQCPSPAVGPRHHPRVQYAPDPVLFQPTCTEIPPGASPAPKSHSAALNYSKIGRFQLHP